MRIVFWDLMPYDFDQGMTADESYSVLMRRLKPGSVIVLHDKASSSALLYLERFLKKAIAGGYTFGSVDDSSSGS